MKKFAYILILLMFAGTAGQARAWNLQDLLGKAKDSMNNTDASDVFNIVDALFSNSDFDVASLEGTWVVSGAAVGLNSESTLAQLGGKAATATLESKLDPYFKKYGLTGAPITFDKEGNFVLKLNRLEIKGTVTKTGKGEFATAFSAFGANKLTPMETWFEKGATGSTLSIMWDASRAMTLLQGISAYVKIKSAQTINSLLSQYKDMYLGFKLTRAQQ